MTWTLETSSDVSGEVPSDLQSIFQAAEEEEEETLWSNMGTTAQPRPPASASFTRTPLQICILCMSLAITDYWLYRLFSVLHSGSWANEIQGVNLTVISFGIWLFYAVGLWFWIGFVGMSVAILVTFIVSSSARYSCWMRRLNLGLQRDFQQVRNAVGLHWASLHVSAPLYLLLPVYSLFTLTIPFGSLRFIVSELHRLTMANDPDADTTKEGQVMLTMAIQSYARWAVLILWGILLGWSGFAAMLRSGMWHLGPGKLR